MVDASDSNGKKRRGKQSVVVVHMPVIGLDKWYAVGYSIKGEKGMMGRKVMYQYTKSIPLVNYKFFFYYIWINHGWQLILNNKQVAKTNWKHNL